MNGDPAAKVYKGLAFALAAAILFGFGYWMLSPGGGADEFRLARKAVSEAHSWRMKFAGTQWGKVEIEAEVACPNAHMVRRATDQRTREAAAYLEFLVRDGAFSQRKDPTSNWEPSETAWGYEFVCMQLLKGEFNPDMLPPFQIFLTMGALNIEKGNRKQMDGVTCRVWHVKYMLAAESFKNEDICIGTEDHLPRERVNSSGSYIFTDWNRPIALPPVGALQ